MSKDTLIRTTPLHQMHLDAGAKMVPFAGYDMPVSYPLGIKKEHNHTREKAGLFDVSHMGQIRLGGANAKKALESIVPVDIIDLPLMKLRYALFTNKSGGVMDDLMVTNLGDEDLFLVVNAGCKNSDFAHLQRTIGDDCKVEFLEDVALLALQGPLAHKVLSEISPSISEMIFMTAKQVVINGIECLITRSGYTGEDGFEIFVPLTRTLPSRINFALKLLDFKNLACQSHLSILSEIRIYLSRPLMPQMDYQDPMVYLF